MRYEMFLFYFIDSKCVSLSKSQQKHQNVSRPATYMISYLKQFLYRSVELTLQLATQLHNENIHLISGNEML